MQKSAMVASRIIACRSHFVSLRSRTVIFEFVVLQCASPVRKLDATKVHVDRRELWNKTVQALANGVQCGSAVFGQSEEHC